MYKNHLKRLLDFTIALIGLIVISPVFLLLWLRLSVANKGAGTFFFQQRSGKNERCKFFEYYLHRDGMSSLCDFVYC